MRAGERAADLTRQLLAFSRQQVLAPRVLDLNASVKACESMLRRLIGEDVELVIRCARSLSRVRADPTHIDQVIMNLAINARDAMPDGGKVTIETKDVMLDDFYVSEHFGTATGPYVMLACSDTGIGMDQETQCADLRPVLHHQRAGQGYRVGVVDGVWRDQAERRSHLGLQRARPRHDLQGLPAASRRSTDRRRTAGFTRGVDR